MYYQNLPLYIKLINLLKVFYQIAHHLPKEYKYSLANDIINRNWELIDFFIEAQTTREVNKKKEVIQTLSICFDMFKIRVRFLSELKLISLGQTAHINGCLEEIGKMIVLQGLTLRGYHKNSCLYIIIDINHFVFQDLIFHK